MPSGADKRIIGYILALLIYASWQFEGGVQPDLRPLI
jgi:hypothetical protein